MDNETRLVTPADMAEPLPAPTPPPLDSAALARGRRSVAIAELVGAVVENMLSQAEGPRPEVRAHWREMHEAVVWRGFFRDLTRSLEGKSATIDQLCAGADFALKEYKARFPNVDGCPHG